MTSGFQQAVINNTKNVFLGQGHFEEVVSFQVNDSAPVVQIAVLETHDDGGIDQQTHHMVESRRLTIMTARSPVIVNPDGTRSDWNMVMPEAFSPKLGNQFTRADGSRWGYSRIQAEDFASYTIVFVGSKLLRAGGKPMGM